MKDMQALEICAAAEKTSTKPNFSEQQMKIIKLKMKRYKQTEIAENLGISASAVRTQVQRIKEKIHEIEITDDEKKMLERIFGNKQEYKRVVCDFQSKNKIFKNEYTAVELKSHFRENQSKSKQIKDLIAKSSGRLFSVERRNAGIMKIIQRELLHLGYTYYSSDKERVTFKLSKKFDLKIHSHADESVDAIIDAVIECIESNDLLRLQQIYLSASREVLTDQEKELLLEEREWRNLKKWAEEARRMLLNEQQIYEFKIELEEMAEVPIWEKHHRGKNWFAKIEKDKNAPGGLKREFIKKATGECYYVIDQNLIIVGSPVEFGADYYTSGGNLHACRWYGVINDITDDMITIIQTKTANKAIKLANSDVFTSKKDILEEEAEKLRKRLAEIAELQLIN